MVQLNKTTEKRENLLLSQKKLLSRNVRNPSPYLHTQRDGTPLTNTLTTAAHPLQTQQAHCQPTGTFSFLQQLMCQQPPKPNANINLYVGDDDTGGLQLGVAEN